MVLGTPKGGAELVLTAVEVDDTCVAENSEGDAALFGEHSLSVVIKIVAAFRDYGAIGIRL